MSEEAKTTLREAALPHSGRPGVAPKHVAGASDVCQSPRQQLAQVASLAAQCLNFYMEASP